MPEIYPILLRLRNVLSWTMIRRLHRIVEGMLCLSGRITQLSISRWAGKGGSYRSVHRFFQSAIDWSAVSWEFFRSSLYDPQATYILAGDATVVGKSGKKTYGVDRFFSSTVGKPIPGLAFLEFALVNVESGEAYPLCTDQVVKSEKEKAQALKRREQRKSTKKVSGRKQAPKRQRGRPAGSKNKNKADVALSPELARTFSLGQQLKERIMGTVRVAHVAMDGHYGNNGACQMARRLGMHLVSKMRSDSELYLLPSDDQKREHPRRKYGARLDYAHPPEDCRVSSEEADNMRTEVYRMRCRHKEFADVLNVVVLVKTDLSTKRRAHVVLFSTDLDLDAQTLIKYYSLRFQIEFVFRDAKQHWGLEDFMGVTKRSVDNAVGLSFFMVNLSTYQLAQLRRKVEQAGVNDLKTYCRGRRYVQEAMKYLPDSPDPIDWERVAERVSLLGFIHAASRTRTLRC